MGSDWVTLVTRDGLGVEYPVTRGKFLTNAHIMAFAAAWNADLPNVGVPPITGFNWGFAPIDYRESDCEYPDDGVW